MTLFDVLLKLIKTFTLTDPESYRQLLAEVKAWEDKCVENSEDKIRSMYWRLHKGVIVKLLMPFLFFIMLKEFRTALSEPEPSFDD